MSSSSDPRNALLSSTRRMRGTIGTSSNSKEHLFGEPKKVTTRNSRKKRCASSSRSPKDWSELDFRGGNDFLLRTAAEGVAALRPSSGHFIPSFGITYPSSTRLDSEGNTSFSKRAEFHFLESAAEVNKNSQTESFFSAVDVATCQTETFDKWLISVLSAIPPSTASTMSLRSGAVASQKAQKNFIFRESILHNIFNLIHSALEVLQRYQLELIHNQSLLSAYYTALEEDTQNQKPEAGKLTRFHYSIREKKRANPILKYQVNTSETEGRISKLTYVIQRLEVLEGLHAYDGSSLSNNSEEEKDDSSSKSDDMYDNSEDENSDDNTLDVFQDGSPEKEKLLSKIKRSKLLKILAKKSKGLQDCVKLPLLSDRITSRLRNELVLPFSARVLSLKEVSTKKGREDQTRSFVEWYVNRVVDPFAMAQLLRIVPMEYVVTTICRLVSVCDGNLSLRATQALPDFSPVVIRAIREGRDEAFSQLALSPSVAFLSALKNQLTSKILFYAALLLGQLNVLRRVLGNGFFHPQALFVLLFFNANWESDDCASYLRHELKLCHEMSDLRHQLKKQHKNFTTEQRVSLEGIRSSATSVDRASSIKTGDSQNSLPALQQPDTSSSEKHPLSADSLKEKIYSHLEATLKAFFAEDIDESSNASTIADEFVYGSLSSLRALLEMREATYRELHAFASSLATTGVNSTVGKERSVALFRNVGVDTNALGGTLRRELEGLRWHSCFIGKNKAYPPGDTFSSTLNTDSRFVPQGSSDDNPQTNDSNNSTTDKSRGGSFGNLLRKGWLDALVGRPLANVMLPTFSTKWLRRTDSRSYLPISPALTPLLIRSDCSVNLFEGGSSKHQLYSSDEALEVKEVQEAEDLRGVRAFSTMDILKAPMRSANSARKTLAVLPTESAPRTYKASRRNKNRLEAHDGNYYFEVHLSLDYLLATSSGEERSEEDLTRGPTPPSSGRIPLLNISTIRAADTIRIPSLQTSSSVNSLVIGFCSENSEADPVGVQTDHSKELGVLPGSGGISLHVVGYRTGVEIYQEDDASVKQVDEVVVKIVRHQDGKTYPIQLPLMEKVRGTRGHGRKRGCSTVGSSMANLPLVEQNTLPNYASETLFYSEKNSRCSSYAFSENENTGIRADRFSVVGSPLADLSHASFVLLRYTRPQATKKSDTLMNSMCFSPVSPWNSPTRTIRGSVSGVYPSPSFEDVAQDETTFPSTNFITEKEFLEWQAGQNGRLYEGLDLQSALEHGNGIRRNTFDTVHEASRPSLEPTAIFEHRLHQDSSSTICNYSIFGHIGLSLGFFVDVKRNVVSLSVNGIPAGTPFTRISSSPVDLLYPAATLQTSLSMIDFLLQSEGNSSISSTPPIIRFAFDKADILGDRLWDARRQCAILPVSGSPMRSRSSSCGSARMADSPSPREIPQSSATPMVGHRQSFILPCEKGALPTVSAKNADGEVVEGPITSPLCSCPGTMANASSPLPDSFLRGVKLLDSSHKFKLILQLLSTRTESSDPGNLDEVCDDVQHPVQAEHSTNGAALRSRNSGIEFDTEGINPSTEPNGEVQWHHRCHRAFNQLSIGGFHDFIFFPSIYIRRRSDDDWKDLQYNGVPIIPERSALSPLCAALACRQPAMALAIASNVLTNMFHYTEAAVRQRRLALLGACALGYTEVVQVLLERMPVYEVLSLFSLQIQREECENLRREHRRRNILMSKVGLQRETSLGAGEAGGLLVKRKYAVTAVNKLDPQKVYTTKGSQYTPIHCALLGGNHTPVVIVLLNYLYTALSFKPYSQLSIAYCKEFRDAEAAGSIFYVGKSYPHLRDAVNVSSKAGETALLMATRLSNAIAAKRFLAFGASPTCQDRISRAFALEIACSNQFLSIAQAIFSTNAYSSALMLNHAGVATPLCWCAINNLAEMIPLLLQNGADPMKGLDGNSPLLLAVTFKSESAALCLLQHCRISLDKDESNKDPNVQMINVNDVDARTQCTALHIACELGMVDVVRALLHCKASLTVVTKGACVTPLHTAILNNENEVALTLLEYTKDQLRRGNVVLNINVVDKNGNTPLHLAVRAGMEEVVEYIVAQFSLEEMNLLTQQNPEWKLPHPVDFMLTNNQGKTPLLIAIQCYEVKCAELIIAYSIDQNSRNPGGTVIEGTCMAILQAISLGLDEVVLLLLSYPQYQASSKVKENFMKTYTAQRSTFDQLEAQQRAEIRRAQKEAARNAREKEEESEYRYFPLVKKEDEEEEDDEESQQMNASISDVSSGDGDGSGFRGIGPIDEDQEKNSKVKGNALPSSLLTRKSKRNSFGKQITNYTGALISRTKTYCPPSRKGIIGGRTRVKSAVNKRRLGDFMRTERQNNNFIGHSISGRKLFVRGLFARSRSKILPEMALKLLLRGFAFPELFVMLEEVAAQSLVVGIQSPSAMVNSESILGFLWEHFDVNILPSNAVKFSRELLEHIMSIFETMSAKKEEFPSWYQTRDQISETIRRYPPFCQNIVRIIRLYGKKGNSIKAIDNIRALLRTKCLETHLPSLRMKMTPSSEGRSNLAKSGDGAMDHEKLEKLFVTPFGYTVLQLATSLRLAPLVSFLLHDIGLSPFYVPMQLKVHKVKADVLVLDSQENSLCLPQSNEASSPHSLSSEIEGQKPAFDYDIRNDDRVFFKDLYNFSEKKWCCSPYRLAIRSFNPYSVASYLDLFSSSANGSNGGESQVDNDGKTCLSDDDIHKVQVTYEECFKVKPEKLLVRVMAVDYREPDWVDPIGNTALQELLADHLSSRLAADEGTEKHRLNGHPRHGNDEEAIHLNRLSSLEIFRGDMKGAALAVANQLLKVGAAASGCFNNLGLDAWLTSFSLDDDAGRAATSLLLHSSPPLLGMLHTTSRRGSPFIKLNVTNWFDASPKGDKSPAKDDNAFFPSRQKKSYFSDANRVTEELRFRFDQLHVRWEAAGYGVPHAIPSEVEVFAPTENNEMVHTRQEQRDTVPTLPAILHGASSRKEEHHDGFEASPAAIPPLSASMCKDGAHREKKDGGEEVPKEAMAFKSALSPLATKEFQWSLTRGGMSSQNPAPPGCNTSSLGVKADDRKMDHSTLSLAFSQYTTFLLFTCIEHNHKKLIPLLQQYPSVLSSSVKHPVTHDSLLTRLLKKAIEELISLGELPAVLSQDLSSTNKGAENARKESLSAARFPRSSDPRNALPLSDRVGTALWEASNRSSEVRCGSSDLPPSVDLRNIDDGGANALEKLNEGYRDPSTIPFVRSILNVSKSLLDNFDIKNLFEPCGEGETAISLASIIGVVDLISRIVQPQRMLTSPFTSPTTSPRYTRICNECPSLPTAITKQLSEPHNKILSYTAEQERHTSTDPPESPEAEGPEICCTSQERGSESGEQFEFTTDKVPRSLPKDGSPPPVAPFPMGTLPPADSIPFPKGTIGERRYERATLKPDGQGVIPFRVADAYFSAKDGLAWRSPSSQESERDVSPVHTLSSALEKSVVRTMLATRVYWGEEDAATLYTLLNNMEKTEQQVSFLTLAYPNIHPLPALWLAVQYVAYADSILHPHECNTAFWGNVLFAKYSNRLDELPVSPSSWNDLLRVLLPRAPAVPVYLIYSHLPGLETTGSPLASNSARRRGVEEGGYHPILSSEYSDFRNSPIVESSPMRRGSQRYPRMKINEFQLPLSACPEALPGNSSFSSFASPGSQAESSATERPAERTGRDDSCADSAFSRCPSSTAPSKVQEYANNWLFIVKRISDFLKVSALVVASSIQRANNEARMSSVNAAKQVEAKGSSAARSPGATATSSASVSKENKKAKAAVRSENLDSGLSGTLLLDVIEVATRYDHPEVVMELIRLNTLLRDVNANPMYDDDNCSLLSAEEQRNRREQEQSAVLSSASILSVCHSLSHISSVQHATTQLLSFEKELWKELLEVRRLDLVAVAAGSQKVLKALYENEITSPFLSILRYDRINVLDGVPELMILPSSNANSNFSGNESTVVSRVQSDALPNSRALLPRVNLVEMNGEGSASHHHASINVSQGTSSLGWWTQRSSSISTETVGTSSAATVLTGYLREYVLLSLRALACRFPRAASQSKSFSTLSQLLKFKPIDWEEVQFCRRCAGRPFVGCQEDRNAVAYTTWGVGGAAKMLQLQGTHSSFASCELSKVQPMSGKKDVWELSQDSPVVSYSLGAKENERKNDTGKMPPLLVYPGSDNTSGKEKNGRKTKKKSFSSEKGKRLHPSFPIIKADSPATVPKAPKPIYQVFLQTDWVVHSSQVLRSPRPSVHTVDMLVFLLEKRAPLSLTALQMFFSASHFSNLWRTSRGQIISLNFQTASHHDSLLHILVMNDQYQLTEYFLTYTLYYFCKWAFDDPNLMPGVFAVSEDHGKWDRKNSPPSKGGVISREGNDGTEKGRKGMKEEKEKNELVELVRAATEAANIELKEVDSLKKSTTFLRMMLRLNTHGLAAFDYARSANMVQLLQRFGCVTPSYRPNPQTFTRAVGLFRMLQNDNRIPEDHYFRVPQIILASEHFLRCEDNKNHVLINRQAGLKANEGNRIKQDKALLATFLTAANEHAESNLSLSASKKRSSGLSSRALGENSADLVGDTTLVRQLLQTQKMTSTLVLPLILNEDVSLLHLGLCAHDDELLQLFGRRRNNLSPFQSTLLKGGQSPHGKLEILSPAKRSPVAAVGFKNLPTVEVPDSPTESLNGKVEVKEEPSSPSLSLSRGEQDEEEKELFSPYLLSLLPQEVKVAEGLVSEKGSPNLQKGTGTGVKLPSLKAASTRQSPVPNVGLTPLESSVGVGGKLLPSDTSHGQRQVALASPSVALGVMESSPTGLQNKILARRPVASSTPPLSKVPPKAPLTQRDVITLLEKRQFIVYPLSLPAAPAQPAVDMSHTQHTTPFGTEVKKAPKKLKGITSALSLSEDVFLKQQMELQHANAEAMIEEVDPINCAAFLISLTPMQLMLHTMKIPVEHRAQHFSIGQQYCSIPTAKLDVYFSSTHLPDKIKNALQLSRHQACEVFVETSREIASFSQGFSVSHNPGVGKGGKQDNVGAETSSHPRTVNQETESEREESLRQVVSVPLLQMQPFSLLKSSSVTNYPQMLDEWVDQFRLRQQRRNLDSSPESVGHGRDSAKKRHKYLGSGSVSRKMKEKPSEETKGKAKNKDTNATSKEGKVAPIARKEELGGSGVAVESGDTEEVEVSPIHTVQPVGGIASAELQSLMRILLRQFSSSAGSKLSVDMGLRIAPNYNVECCGDPIAAAQSKGHQKKEELIDRRKK